MRFIAGPCIAAAALAAGCSTTPITAPSTTGPAIVFVRDSGVWGSGCTYDLTVNGGAVGRIDSGGSLVVRVERGRHRVSMESASLICPSVKLSKVVEVIDRPVVLRMGLTSQGQTIFDQVE